MLRKDGVAIATASTTLKSSLPLAPSLPEPRLPWNIFVSFLIYIQWAPTPLPH